MLTVIGNMKIQVLLEEEDLNQYKEQVQQAIKANRLLEKIEIEAALLHELISNYPKTNNSPFIPTLEIKAEPSSVPATTSKLVEMIDNTPLPKTGQERPRKKTRNRLNWEEQAKLDATIKASYSKMSAKEIAEGLKLPLHVVEKRVMYLRKLDTKNEWGLNKLNKGIPEEEFKRIIRRPPVQITR